MGKPLADKALRLLTARQLPRQRDLMVHCAQEMTTLAASCLRSSSDSPPSDRLVCYLSDMSKTLVTGVLAACGALLGSPVAHADRIEPPPMYGYYDVSIDFSKQTFNGMPTPMNSMTFPVEFTTQCDVNGCVVHMDNAGDHARNPGAPSSYEYRWNNGRWETSGEYPYFCDRNDPSSVVTAQRSDYWIPNPDGSFFGQRTLVVGGAGCPGEGPGTHVVPISSVPSDPPR